MDGLGLPNYAREYEREFRRYDRFLRLRRSVEQPGLYLLERKTARLWWPDLKLGTDRAIQYRDSYRTVMKVFPDELQYVMASLRSSDIQQLGGAKGLANALDEEDARIEALRERRTRTAFEEAGSEFYARLAWEEDRRVSMGGHAVESVT
jgi:hypothetical protein